MVREPAGNIALGWSDLRQSFDRSRLVLPCPREAMREIIARTAAASGQRDAAIRYWISAGPGSLGNARTFR